MSEAAEKAILRDLGRRVAARLSVAEENVPLDADIVGGLGLDSISMLELLIEIEADYPRLDLEDPATRKLRSLREFATWLSELHN